MIKLKVPQAKAFFEIFLQSSFCLEKSEHTVQKEIENVAFGLFEAEQIP